MSDAATCPACTTLPEGPLEKAASNGTAEIVLSLPGIHCVGCINGVEKALRAVDGVANARVNLSMKRVTVGTDQPVAPEALIDTLKLITSLCILEQRVSSQNALAFCQLRRRPKTATAEVHKPTSTE